jgi:hypothetical protein
LSGYRARQCSNTSKLGRWKVLGKLYGPFEFDVLVRSRIGLIGTAS